MPPPMPSDADLSARVTPFVDANLPRWTALLRELIRIPSCFEQEHAIIERVARHIELLGLPVIRVYHDADWTRSLPGAQPPFSTVAGRCSLVTHVPGAGHGRSLVVSTHLDIVPEGDAALWHFPPYAGHIDVMRNVIYGRGAMDDKAGVVVSLALLEALSQGPIRPAGNVVFHYVLEDETTGNGTLLCLDAGHGADAALILDGTRRDKAVHEHAGNMEFELRLAGQPASVAVSHVGINAAEMAARLLLRLRDGVFALNADRMPPWTRFPSPFQFVIHKFMSVGALKTVPAEAWAQCYLTFPPPYTLAATRTFLEEAAEQFAREQSLPTAPAFNWDGFATEPVRSATNEFEAHLQASAAALCLPPIEVGPSTGTSDLRHFVSAGIPCLLYGPGAGFNPHRPDEHYHLDDLPLMVHIYLNVIQSWCGLAEPLRRAA